MGNSDRAARLDQSGAVPITEPTGPTTTETLPGAVPVTSPAGSPAHASPKLLVSVHNGHCHQYGICQQEAPEVFHLRSDTRLNYDRTPPAEQSGRVRQAVRLCPMQAITVQSR